jgi:hypothetical protein
MGVLFKQKMDVFLDQGLKKKEARHKALKWFEDTNTCRGCDSVIKAGDRAWEDITYCIHCMS